MEEILNSLPEPMQVNATALIIAVLFLVLIAVLNQLIFKPLISVLEERQKRIEEGKEASVHSTTTVEESEAAYRESVIEARKKGQAFRQNLLKESEMAREEIITSAREQALAMVQAAATELEQQVGTAKASLKKETEDIAGQIVASVLSRTSA